MGNNNKELFTLNFVKLKYTNESIYYSYKSGNSPPSKEWTAGTELPEFLTKVEALIKEESLTDKVAVEDWINDLRSNYALNLKVMEIEVGGGTTMIHLAFSDGSTFEFCESIVQGGGALSDLLNFVRSAGTYTESDGIYRPRETLTPERPDISS